MRRTCQVYGPCPAAQTPVEIAYQCDKPAVDYVDIGGQKIWMCAYHWDEHVKGSKVFEDPAKRGTNVPTE